MNCKKGDLAIIVRSATGLNVGKIVRCIQLSRNHKKRYETGQIVFSDCWLVDPPVRSTGPIGFTHYVQDSWLRPIRPSDGEDEMLRIAGKPGKKNAIA